MKNEAWKMVQILKLCDNSDVFTRFIDFDALEHWICEAYHSLGYETYFANFAFSEDCHTRCHVVRAIQENDAGQDGSTVKKFQSNALEGNFFGVDSLEVCIKTLENLCGVIR